MSTSPKRLYRSSTNRVIAGVCGGIAEYLDIDPTLMRIVWVLLTIFGGWGILLYIAAVIIVPLNPSTTPAGATQASDSTAVQLIGIVLVVVGCFFLFSNLGFFSFREMTRFVWNYLLPLSLIGAGVYILVRRRESSSEQPPTSPPAEPSQPTAAQEQVAGRKKRGSAKKSAPETPSSTPQPEPAPPPRRRLLRSFTDRKLFGICGGLGEYFDIDPTIVRVIFVIFTLMSFGFGILLYIVLLFSMPEKPRPVTT